MGVQEKRGVQGKAVEYLLDSLPEEIQSQLILSDQSIDYVPQRPDPFQIWKAVYYQLTEDESSKIVTYILREGLSALLIQVRLMWRPEITSKSLPKGMKIIARRQNKTDCLRAIY